MATNWIERMRAQKEKRDNERITTSMNSENLLTLWGRGYDRIHSGEAGYISLSKRWQDLYKRATDYYNNEAYKGFYDTYSGGIKTEGYDADAGSLYKNLEKQSQAANEGVDELLSELDQYSRYYNEDAVKYVRDLITQRQGSYNDLLKSAGEYRDHFAQWENEDAYNADVWQGKFAEAYNAGKYDEAEALLEERGKILQEKYKDDPFSMTQDEDYQRLLAYEENIKLLKEREKYEPFINKYDGMSRDELKGALEELKVTYHNAASSTPSGVDPVGLNQKAAETIAREMEYVNYLINETSSWKKALSPYMDFAEKVADIGEKLGVPIDDKHVAALPSDIKNLNLNIQKLLELPNYFQGSNLFEDGWQFGDVTKTTGASIADLGVNLLKGATSAIEGVVDLGAYGVAAAVDAGGDNEIAGAIRRAATQSQSDQLWGGLHSAVNPNSVLSNTTDELAQSLAQMYMIGLAAGSAGLGTLGTTILSSAGMGLSTMGSSMGEAYQGGADDWEALAYGAMSGTIEAGSELIFGGLGKAVNALGYSKGISSLDDAFAKKLSNEISSQFWKNAVQFGVKAGAEGFEEVIAGLGSAVAKKLTYLSEEDLGKLIADERLLEAFISGAVMSGLAQSGLIPGTKKGSFIESVRQGRDFITGLTADGQKFVDNEFAARLSEAEKNGQKLSRRDKLRAYEDVVKSITIDENVQDQFAKVNAVQRNHIKTDIEKKISSEISDKQARAKMAEALTKIAYGENVSNSDLRKIAQSKKALKVVEEITGTKHKAGEVTVKELRKEISAKQSNTTRLSNENILATAAALFDMDEVGERSLMVSYATDLRNSEDGKIAPPEQYAAAYNSVYSAGKKGMDVSATSSRASSILSDSAIAQAYRAGQNAAGEKSASASVAENSAAERGGSDILSSMNIPGLDNNKAYYKLDDLGVSKADQDALIDAGIAEKRNIRGEVVATIKTSMLQNELRRRENSSKKTPEFLDEGKVKEAQAKIDAAKSKDGKKKKGTVIFDGDRKKLTGIQKQSLAVLDKLSEALGVTFHIYKSKNENGRYVYTKADGEEVSANGWYDLKTDEIWIDLNAGNNGEGVMIFTAAHELTHFIKKWSAAKFKVFGEFLIEQYQDHNISVDELVQERIDKAANNNRKLSWDEAYEEVIADSCESFLRDSNAVEKIVALNQKDASLVSKIKQFIGNMLKRLRELMSGMEPQSAEGKIVADMTSSLEKLYELWTDALVDAGEAYSGAEGLNDFEASNSETRYSERDFPIDSSIETTVKNAFTKSHSDMHELGNITEGQNSAINRLVNQTNDQSYRGKYTGGKHLFSDNAIKHIIREHGDFLREGLRAQLPMTATDIARHLSAIKDNKVPSSTKASKTKEGRPSILTSYEVNGYTLYAEEIKKPLGKNLPSDLIGHTMYKAPTLPTAAALATSARTLPKRQSTVLCNYYTPNSHRLSTGNFIKNNNNFPARLSFLVADGSPKSDQILGALIALSSNDSNFTDKSGKVDYGYVRCNKPFYITVDNRVFSNSDANVAEKINELKKQGYDCFVFEKTPGDNYMVAVVNKAQIIKDQPTVVSSGISTAFSSSNNNPHSDRDPDAPTNRELLINAGESYSGAEGIDNSLKNDKLSDRDYSYDHLSSSDYYQNSHIYSYDFLTAQKDMTAVELPNTGIISDRNGKIDDSKVLAMGVKNATSEGVVRGKKIYITNTYTGRELRIDNSTIRHGLDGTFNRHLTNARIGSVIGSVVKNAIPINGLKNSADKAIGTYAMVAYCNDSQNREFIAVITVEQHSGQVDSFELYDVAHAVSGRQKKGSQVDTKSQGVYPIKATTISISRLIEIVKTTHQSILSEDVLSNLGEVRNHQGSYADKVLFSDRDPDALIDAGEAYSGADADGHSHTDGDTLYSDRYSYEALVNKPDMKLTTINNVVQQKPTKPMRKNAVDTALENAKSIGTVDSTGAVSVYVKDIGSDVILSRSSLAHGLDRRFSENLPATLHAGEILKHAIRINELSPKIKTASASYVMIGAAKSRNGDISIVEFVVNEFTNEVASIDVLKSINTKKEAAVLNAPPPTNNSLRITASNISIAQLLDFVNRFFPDILPESVWRHYGHAVRPDGELGKSALFSDRDPDAPTNRELLINALETDNMSPSEKGFLTKYKNSLSKIEANEAEISRMKSELKELQKNGKGKTAKAISLENKISTLEKQVSVAERLILNLEVTRPIKNLLNRERTAAYKKAVAEGNEKLAEYKQKVREREQEIRQGYRDSRAKSVEGRRKTKVREQIREFKKKLQKTLKHPTDRKYIPGALAQAMIDICELIDTDTELYKADGTVNKAQERRNETRERLAALREEYKKIKDDADPLYAGEYDQEIADYLEALEREFKGKSIRDMELGELEKMYEYLQSIDETLREARKLIGWKEGADAYDAGGAIIAEQKGIASKRKKGERGAIKKLDDGIANYSLSPVRRVLEICGYNENSPLYKLFKEFEKGVRSAKFFEMQAKKSFESLTSGKNAATYENAVYEADGGEIYTDSRGRKFGISKMQKMQAILSYERETTNKKTHHIDKGGLVFADLKALKQGDLRKATSSEHSHKVSSDSAVKLVEKFKAELEGDAWAQAYMAAARAFFNETAKGSINDTFMKLKHRILATENAYIPFEVDQSSIVREIDAKYDVQKTISSYGMLQDVQRGSVNPLIMTGLNNVLDRHIEQVSIIHGLAVPIRNFNKVWNVKSVDGATNVREQIEATAGGGAIKVIEQTVQDIQGPRQKQLSSAYKKVKSNYIGATFWWNASVMFKQIGSLFSATSIIGYRNPVQMLVNLGSTVINRKKISAEVDKYTASAWMRRQGMSDAELQTLSSEKKRSWFGKLIQSGSKGMIFMDHAVALSLWKYAKQDVAKKTGLRGEELLKSTAEYYDEVIETTQSMTDVLHRPEIQRSGGIGTELLGTFKTDLYQNAGNLRVAMGQFANNKSRANAAKLGKTVGSILTSALWASVVTSLMAILRYKPNRYRDEEDDELTPESWLKVQGTDLLQELAGYIAPLAGSEIVEAVNGIREGKSVGNLIASAIPFDAVNDLYSDICALYSKISEGKDLNENDYYKIINDCGNVLGIPTANITRALQAIKLHAKDIANGEFLSFEAGLTDPNAYRLYKAMLEGDSDKIDKASRNFKNDEAITKAIREQLREQDPRIREAAAALVNGDVGEYEKIFNEIYEEGVFEFEDILQAIFSEEEYYYNKIEDAAIAKYEQKTEDYNDLLDGIFERWDCVFDEKKILSDIDEMEKTVAEGANAVQEKRSMFKVNHVNLAFDRGDGEMALSVIEDIISVKVENALAKAEREAYLNGEPFDEYEVREEAEKKARSTIRSAMTTHYNTLYCAAYDSGDRNEMQRIENIIYTSGVYLIENKYGRLVFDDDVFDGWIKEWEKENG